MFSEQRVVFNSSYDQKLYTAQNIQRTDETKLEVRVGGGGGWWFKHILRLVRVNIRECFGGMAFLILFPVFP